MCLTQQPPPVPGCVKMELHSACAPRLLRGHGRTYPRTALLLVQRVARSSRLSGRRVARRHPVTTLTWPLVRCAAAPVFLSCAVEEDDCHLVSSDGLCARRPEVDTFLSSMWGDWIVIAQGDIGNDPSSPRRVTREHRGSHALSPWARCCASFSSLFSSWNSNRLGRGTLAGSTPAPYGTS